MSFYKYNFPSTILSFRITNAKSKGNPSCVTTQACLNTLQYFLKPMLLFYLGYYIFFESSKSLRNTLLLGMLYLQQIIREIFCTVRQLLFKSNRYTSTDRTRTTSRTNHMHICVESSNSFYSRSGINASVIVLWIAVCSVILTQ